MLHAPVTHVTSFLILHELTAIVPLVSLAATFHYTNWLPPYISEGAWVKEGVERFGRYFRKKGWLSEADVAWAEKRRRDRAWWVGEGGVRVVLEVATAWAVVKLLLPARIALSVWATPWFARSTIVPFGGFLKKVFGGGKSKAAAGGGAGAGAMDAGQRVRNEGPLYQKKPAASAPAQEVKKDATAPGVKNDGPLYKNSTPAK